MEGSNAEAQNDVLPLPDGALPEIDRRIGDDSDHCDLQSPKNRNNGGLIMTAVIERGQDNHQQKGGQAKKPM